MIGLVKGGKPKPIFRGKDQGGGTRAGKTKGRASRKRESRGRRGRDGRLEGLVPGKRGKERGVG